MFELADLRLPTFSEWVAVLGGLYDRWGYAIVPIAAALENTFIVNLFFPGGTILILGGVYARIGQLDLAIVILLGWLGTFLGASFDYCVGRGGGRSPLARLLDHPRVAPPLAHAGMLLGRYGFLAFLGGHFTSHTRSVIAIAAALTGMSPGRFVLYELPAAFIWSTTYVVGGYLLAHQLHVFEEFLNRFGWYVAIGLLAFFGWQTWRTFRGGQKSDKG